MKSFALLLLNLAMLATTLVQSFTAHSARAGRRCAMRSIGGVAFGSCRPALVPSPPVASTSSARSFQPAAASAPSTTTRWMSSPAEPDTSVVETCRAKIAVALETEDVKVLGAYDDPNGSHISIEVTSALFEGKRPVQRQQLVYKALWEELQGAVHAVDSMVCKTPAEK